MIKKTSDIIEEVISMHEHGLPTGERQGFPLLDQALRLVPGGCTDIIGYPFHGKSLLFKEYVMNLATNCGWRWLLHMPDEGDDVHVVSNLIHIYTGKTFLKGKDHSITKDEIVKAWGYLAQILDLVSADYAISPLELFELAEKGKYNGLGIDSWNKLAHKGSPKDSDYVNQTLSERNRVAMRSGVHILQVMHPKNPLQQEIVKGEVGVPSVYQIAGGAEVNNNARNIIAVHKPDRNDYSAPYQIVVQKIKPKQCGEVGAYELRYDWPLQRWYDIEPGKAGRHYANKLGIDKNKGEFSDRIIDEKNKLPF